MTTAAPRRPAPRGWAFSRLGFVRRVFVGAYEDNIPFLASALTFDALLWLLPFVLLAASVFGYIVGSSDVPLADVRTLIARFLPEHGDADPFGTAEGFITGVVESRVQLSLYGLPLFVWFSLRLFGSVRVALNDVFDTEETRPWLVGKGIDLLLAVGAALSVTANTLMGVLVLQSPWLGRFLAGVSTFAFGVALFYIVYRVAPARRVRWDTALVAAVAASLSFELAKRLYTVYLGEFATFDRVISNSNAIALLLFVLWVYYTCFVFLAGGELAETYDLARRQREQRALLT
ncbi:MAG: YihY/virulence factor BrkB family protein [Gemmatimonadales bacterium]